MATLGVQILGDAAGLKAALGQATAATEEYAAASKVAFAGVSDATLKAQLAQVRLGQSTAKYGEGSVGAAAATLAYRRQIESLQQSHLRAAQSIGRGLTTYVTAPTALLGFEAVKSGIEFQRQMLLIQTQAGASAAEVKNLTGQVIALAPAVGMGPTQLAQGLYHLESLGLRGRAAMNTLHISAIAAGMGIANLEDVTTALGGAVVTGIKGAQNYQQAMATLTATVGAGNMRFEDLAGAIGKVAAPAAAAGITLPELGASMAVLTDRGLSADEAATRLRMAFGLLQAPSDKAKKALKDMGINADSLAVTLRQPGGLQKVLEELKAGISNVGETRGNRDLIKAFGGGRSSLGIQILVGSLSNALSGYQKKLEDVSAGERKYAANQKAYMESPAFKLRQDLAQAQADLTKFGEAFAPVAVKVAHAFGLMGDAFGKLPAEVKVGLEAIIALLAVGGPLLLSIAGVVRAVGTIRTAFGLVPVTAGPAIAATEGELVGLEGSAAAAEGSVLALRTALLGLGAIGAITIGIDLVEHLIKGYRSTHDLGKSQGRGGQAGHVLEQNGKYYLVSPQNAGRGGPGGMRQITPAHAHELLGQKITGDTYRAPVRGIDTPNRFAPAPSAAEGGGGGGGGGGGLIKSFSLPFVLQQQAALAGLTKSNQDDLQAARAEIAYIDKLRASGRLSHKALLAALGEEGSAYQQLYAAQSADTKKAAAVAKKERQKAEHFALPLVLQVAEAKADALAALAPNTSGPSAEQLKLAKVAKADAMKAINSHKLTMQALIEAWGVVQSANGTIAQALGTQKQVVKTSAEKLIAGIPGLTEAQKVALEARYAQAQAHNGVVPTGVAANGVVIHNVHLPNVKDAKAFLAELQRMQKQGSRQTRGRHGGNSLAF